MKKASLFLLICCIVAQSQAIDKYTFAFKANTYPYASPIEEGIEVNAFLKTYLFTAGYYFGEDYELWVSPPEKYKQLNLLFGKYNDSKNEKFRFQYQAGIGIFWGRLRTNEIDEKNSGFVHNAYFTRDIKKSIALPIKIGGRYMPFPFLGIGIDILANINQHKTLLRPMLSIEIGKLRNK